MTVSATLASSARPCSACLRRLGPSNAKGLVTTATVSAPSSLASDATTGAAPVPVPPPRPAVTNTMSAPSSRSMIFSVSSSAACRPTAGSEPAPRPFVIFEPMASLAGTRARPRAPARRYLVRRTRRPRGLHSACARRHSSRLRPRRRREFCVLGADSSSIMNFNASSAMLFSSSIVLSLPHSHPTQPIVRLCRAAAGAISISPNTSPVRRRWSTAGFFNSSGQSPNPLRQAVASLAFRDSLRHVAHAVQQRAAAGEHDAFEQIALHADALQFRAHVQEQSLRRALPEFHSARCGELRAAGGPRAKELRSGSNPRSGPAARSHIAALGIRRLRR